MWEDHRACGVGSPPLFWWAFLHQRGVLMLEARGRRGPLVGRPLLLALLGPAH